MECSGIAIMQLIFISSCLWIIMVKHKRIHLEQWQNSVPPTEYGRTQLRINYSCQKSVPLHSAFDQCTQICLRNYCQTGNSTFSRTLDFASGGGITDASVASHSINTAVIIRNDLAISSKAIKLFYKDKHQIAN